MFRDGQYLEVIKISESRMATAIITVKEKSVEIDKKKIVTNKWLNLEDWSSLYKIVQRAVLRNWELNHEKNGGKSMERRKSTRTMDVIYSYEAPKDSNSLPTLRARVSPARRRHSDEKSSKDHQKPDLTSLDTFETKTKRNSDCGDEEYVPSDIAKPQKPLQDLEYVPSRKSDLKHLKKSEKSRVEEYTPTLTAKSDADAAYVPNSIASLKKKTKHEVYEPSGVSGTADVYIPSSMGSKTRVEEYEPDFSTATMNINVTYVPSSKKRKKDGDDKDSDRKRVIVKKKSAVEGKTKREI